MMRVCGVLGGPAGTKRNDKTRDTVMKMRRLVNSVKYKDSHTSDLPAALIRPTAGELVWLVDQAAGRWLNDVGTKFGRADHDP